MMNTERFSPQNKCNSTVIPAVFIPLHQEDDTLLGMTWRDMAYLGVFGSIGHLGKYAKTCQLRQILILFAKHPPSRPPSPCNHANTESHRLTLSRLEKKNYIVLYYYNIYDACCAHVRTCKVHHRLRRRCPHMLTCTEHEVVRTMCELVHVQRVRRRTHARLYTYGAQAGAGTMRDVLAASGLSL